MYCIKDCLTRWNSCYLGLTTLYSTGKTGILQKKETAHGHVKASIRLTQRQRKPDISSYYQTLLAFQVRQSVEERERESRPRFPSGSIIDRHSRREQLIPKFQDSERMQCNARSFKWLGILIASRPRHDVNPIKGLRFHLFPFHHDVQISEPFTWENLCVEPYIQQLRMPKKKHPIYTGNLWNLSRFAEMLQVITQPKLTWKARLWSTDRQNSD